jgi:hypothetical protein
VEERGWVERAESEEVEISADAMPQPQGAGSSAAERELVALGGLDERDGQLGRVRSDALDVHRGGRHSRNARAEGEDAPMR